MRAMGRIGDIRGLTTVTSGLEDTVGQVRKSAVVAAGQLGDVSVIDGLIISLNDPFYGARLMALESLVRLDTPAVVIALEAVLDREPAAIGDLACGILGRLATDAAVELLAGELESISVDRRARAALALVEADPTDNCGYLRSFLAEEPDRLVVLKVRSALAETGYEFQQP
jgi:HEAT repeat protein